MRTRQFWVGGEYGSRVAWHFYFGHDSDASLGSVGHQIAQFVLRIIATISAWCIFRTVGGACFAPFQPRLYGAIGNAVSKARIAFNLHAPSLGIGQMQVQTVKFVAGHHVYLLFQEANGEEVAHHVNHQSTPFIGGLVNNVGTGYTLLC